MVRLSRYPGETTIVLLVIGAALIGVSGFFIIANEYYGPGDVESDALYFLFAGVGLSALGALLTLMGRSQYLWVGGNYFGFKSGWPFHEVEVTFKIREYAGLNWAGTGPLIEVEGGEVVEIPIAMTDQLSRLDKIVMERCNYLRFQEGLPPLGPESVHQTCSPPVPWPPVFTFEQSGAVEPSRDPVEKVQIDDPDALRTLVRQYKAAAIFRESFPPAFDLAKIFIGLKRSNGGLVLIGVHPSGEVVGLPEEELGSAQERLVHLASELTKARVEIGRIEIDGKIALFAVFNATQPNIRPLDSFNEATSNVAIV